MKNILHIISSPQGAQSVSIKLGNSIVSQLQQTFPGSTVTELNLAENPLPHLDETTVTALRTPEDQHSDIQKEAIKASDAAIAQLFDADILVIGVPLYNFGAPSQLKSWLDHIARAGKTFSYSPEGAKGHVEGKKVYLAFSAGAVYSDGPYKAYDFATPYLTAVLGFIGITDITIIRAEGLAFPDMRENAVERALEAFAI
ncbi:FMN-dependent NADH-azoreductase [Flavobacterium akiainvivens]|uniref:FMN dependent NADH:quinone oxidoreductase n=1 Tax=Flavobacterium akiainvivens TaxID=1202724 RepID=A0A0M8MJP6_9FLAO|nr:FMN-dependent NADH-azoreductase [Flavobacterium akiainvivens]KOS07197.1 FMN-dependent NADH-azoreductase [Flavobacterium akiainvivens]SFQ72706.1 FMN-dependent NADH-azoreductase [Flavobacterium akiainvivens]